MNHLPKDRVLRIAALGFLITAVLGLGIAGFLATRFKGEIMRVEDIGRAGSDGSPIPAQGLPAPILERLVRDYQGVTYTAIAGGFVILFISLTAIAVYGQRTVGRERNSLRTRNSELLSSIDQLKNNQERLNQVLNSAGAGICSLDAEGRITFANQAVTRMTGWKYAELIGRHMHVTLHQPKVDGSPFPEEDCPICQTWREGVEHTVTDEVFWRRNLSSFPVEYVTTPISLTSGLTTNPA